MLYMTRYGVYDTCTDSLLHRSPVGASQQHPHGFIDGQRVYGFRRAVKDGALQMRLSGPVQLPCGCCWGNKATALTPSGVPIRFLDKRKR